MKRSRKVLSGILLASVAAWYVPNATAAFAEWNTLNSWGAAAKGIVVVENFEDTTLEPEIASISPANYNGYSGGIDTGLGGRYLDRVGDDGAGTTASTVFSFSTLVHGVGGFWDLSVSGPGTAINLFVGSTLVSTLTPTLPSSLTGEFFGFTSTVYFNAFEIRADGVGQETYGIQDLYISAVPLPAAVWLFGSAVIGMGVIGRRKRAANLQV